MHTLVNSDPKSNHKRGTRRKKDLGSESYALVGRGKQQQQKKVKPIASRELRS